MGLLKSHLLTGLEISELYFSLLLSFLDADLALTIEDVDLVITVMVLDFSFLELCCLAEVVGYLVLEVFGVFFACLIFEV